MDIIDIGHVTSYKYLGVYINNDGWVQIFSLAEDILEQSMIQQANKIVSDTSQVWTETKIELRGTGPFVSIVIIIILYLFPLNSVKKANEDRKALRLLQVFTNYLLKSMLSKMGLFTCNVYVLVCTCVMRCM